MDSLNDKEIAKSFVKMGIISWLSAMAIIPYFLVSFALMDINSKWGSWFFDYLFSFAGPPTILSIILIIIYKKFPQVGGIKEYIANNAKKVFFSGVIVFYSLIILGIIINIDNIVRGIMIVVFSFVAFPFGYMMLHQGLKNINRFMKTIDSETLIDTNSINNNQIN